jgi:hypothetical protein
MAMRGGPAEAVHLSHRSNWLRAAVLGANDGIVSTASLVLGVPRPERRPAPWSRRGRPGLPQVRFRWRRASTYP